MDDVSTRTDTQRTCEEQGQTCGPPEARHKKELPFRESEPDDN
jgi:hypothetical protein